MSHPIVAQRMEQIKEMTGHVARVCASSSFPIDAIAYSIPSEDACSVLVYIQFPKEYETGKHRAELETLLLSASRCGIDGTLAEIHFCHALPDKAISLWSR